MTAEQFLTEYANGRRDFTGSILSDADLSDADLSDADLSEANLSEANLYNADLSGANLYNADLYNADLSEANLSEANLSGANLSGTVLDPENKLSRPKILPFERQGDRLVGYRSKQSRYVGNTVYQVGETYRADVFSTCPATVCHPGLFLCETVQQVVDLYSDEVVKVSFLEKDLHRAGSKWRVKEFVVEGDVQ